MQNDQPVNRWSTEKAWAVLQAQDTRNVPALCSLLKDTTWQVRRAAALAFASVRTGEGVDCLRSALRDKQGAVRAAAAFAMGLCGNTDEAEEMVDMLRYEHDQTVRYALWEAAGRTGDELTLKRLLAQEKKTQYDSLGAAWCMYAMALEGFANDSAAATCFELLLSPDIGVRLGAAHALARMNDQQLLAHKGSLGKWLTMEPSAEIRMALIRAFGKVAGNEDLPVIRNQYAQAKALERVNLIRACAKLNCSQSLALLLEACTDEGGQVAKTAATVLIQRKDMPPSSRLIGKVKHDEVALILDAAALRTLPHSKSRFVWQSRLLQSTNPYIRAQMKAIAMERGRFSPVPDWTKMALDDSASFLERTAATQAMFNYLGRQKSLGEDDLLGLSKLLNGKDPGVLADVAIYIADNPELKGNDPAKLALFAEYAIAQLRLPRDLEAKLMLVKAIAHLKGEEPPLHAKTVYSHPIDRRRLNALPNGQQYTIETTKGVIKLITLVDEAPGSCLAFDSLVQAGYYNGKAFHRVVPNFVAQAGCPRGDGYGSLDWTLRTEVALSRYSRGSIGLASAGADTESCQFFITHSPTPHLDGRYTRFAQVVEGMDVVNELGVGDVILSMMKSD